MHEGGDIQERGDLGHVPYWPLPSLRFLRFACKSGGCPCGGPCTRPLWVADARGRSRLIDRQLEVRSPLAGVDLWTWLRYVCWLVEGSAQQAPCHSAETEARCGSGHAALVGLQPGCGDQGTQSSAESLAEASR